MILTSILLVLVFNSCLLPRFVFGQRIFFENEDMSTAKKWNCLTNDNQKGLCKDQKRCFTHSGKAASICGYTGSLRPVICCPITRSQVIKTAPIILKKVTAPVVKFECGKPGVRRIKISLLRNASLIKNLKNNYDENSFVTDIEEAHVVGGRNAKYTPWMALFGRIFRGQPEFFCGGVLINEQFVLTAAHCVLDPKPFFIRLGEYNFANTEDNNDTETFQVEKIFFQPKYKLTEGYHDLALVKLTTKVSISDNIRPVCLPWGSPSNADLIGQNVTVFGWGALYFGGPPTSILQSAVVKVLDPKDCHQSYSTLSLFKSKFPQGMNLDNTLCCGDKEGGKDACQGDSGGPLVRFDQGKSFLAGIISQGYGCAENKFPGLSSPSGIWTICNGLKKQLSHQIELCYNLPINLNYRD